MNKYTTLLSISLLFIAFQAQGQGRGTYTVLQAGGIFGFSTSSEQNPMQGYQVHFALGRNFYDRMYLGFGLGNDVYRGKTILANGNKSTRRVSALPLYADFRVPVARVGPLGAVNLLANAGYAPSIGNDYFKGVVAKAGITYGHLLAERSDLLFSFGYGFQQFENRFLRNSFNQHNVFLTVGLFVH